MSCVLRAGHGLEMFVTLDNSLLLKQQPFGDDEHLIVLTLQEAHWMRLQLDGLVDQMDKAAEELRKRAKPCPAA